MIRIMCLAASGALVWAAFGGAAIGQNADCRWVPGYGWQCPRPSGNSGVARVAQKPAEEIVRVIVPHGGRSNTEDRGSGVLVVGPSDEYGWILTAEHVTKHRRACVVEFPDRRRYHGIVLRSNRAEDLALVRIAKPHVSPRMVAEDEPQINSQVYLAGYPAGGSYRSWVTRRANVYESGRRLEVLGNAQNGTSGGPMIDERGRVVSVISTTQRMGAQQWTTSGCLTARLHDILRPKPNLVPVQKPIVRPQTTPAQAEIDYDKLASLVAAKLPKPGRGERGEKGERGERGPVGPPGSSAEIAELSALRKRVALLEEALSPGSRERAVPAYFEIVPRRK